MSDLVNRRAYIEQLLDCEPAIEPNGYEVPAQPRRFSSWRFAATTLSGRMTTITSQKPRSPSKPAIPTAPTYDLDETQLAQDQQLHRQRAGYLRKVREGYRYRPGHRLPT
jgi:hypothetical protein